MGKAKNRGKADKDPAGEVESSSVASNGSLPTKPSSSDRLTHELPRYPKKEPLKSTKKHAKKKPLTGLSSGIGTTCAVILAVGAYFLYIHWQEQRILTPFVGSLIPYDRSYKNSLLWGTYRPGLYFGVRSRTVDSVEMGLMWFSYNAHQLFLRHLCDQNDKLRYGWQQHDGRTFGYQEILDDQFNISTTFLKRYK
jgi:mannosyl-oligosaccharide glucosidase